MNILSEPAVGDHLHCQKNAFIRHVGVYLNGGWVLQNTPQRGEHVVHVGEFFRGRAVKIKSMNAAPQAVMQRASEVLRSPKPYNPLLNNCEHTASKVTTGTAHSEQVFIWGLLALVLIAIKR